MKKVVAVVIATLMVAVLMTGCTESEQVSYNIGKEADNFNVTRKLTHQGLENLNSFVRVHLQSFILRIF